MTLQDLWLLVKHYARWVLIVPLLCALILGAGAAFNAKLKGNDVEATSTICYVDLSGLVSAGNLSNLLGVVAQEEIDALPSDTIVDLKQDTSAQSLSFTVKAESFAEASSLAISLANNTTEKTKEILVNLGDKFLETALEAQSTENNDAISVEANTSPAERFAALQSVLFKVSVPNNEGDESSISSWIKYAAVGLLGGLFMVVCGLALFDSIRRPIKGEEDVSDVTDLPILVDRLSKDFTERLWINVQFAYGGKPESLCIVPLFGTSVGQIQTLMENEGIDVDLEFTSPIEESITASVKAHEADAVVILAKLWVSTEVLLMDTLKEMKLAKVNVVGVVLEA